jgi:hypothetical protein
VPSLPERPNLEHLKKQAKDLLRFYQRRDPDAFRRLRTSLPVAKHKDDDALTALELRLHDAQSCVPRWTPENRPSIDTSKPATTPWRPRPSVIDRVVSLWSSVLLSFTTTSLGCANVGISRSLRDFQSPVETFFVVSMGLSFAWPSSASPRIEPIEGGCCTLAGVPIVVPRGSYAVVLDRRTALQPLRDSPASTLPRETHGFTSSRPRRASRCGPWCASCVVRT